MTLHRDMSPIPTDAEKRKAEVLWLQEHPLWTYPVDPPPRIKKDMMTLGSWLECIEIDAVYVDPTTESIVGDSLNDPANTVFRVWIEAGGWYNLSEEKNLPEPEGGWGDHNKWVNCYDSRLDCGGPDLETALLELARRVRFYYGEGRERRDLKDCGGEFVPNPNGGSDVYVPNCKPGDDGFCLVCGFEMETNNA